MLSSNAHTVFSLQTSVAAHDHVYGVHELEMGISPLIPYLAMSRIHTMGRVVYWSAGALVVLNCVPHTLPGILKMRCALHCSQLHTLTHYTLSHNAHSHTAHYLHNAHTHTVMSSKTRLRLRNWWLMFAELQLPWCMHSLPQVEMAPAAIVPSPFTHFPPSHTVTAPP